MHLFRKRERAYNNIGIYRCKELFVNELISSVSFTLGYLEEVKFVCSILNRLECILEFRSPNDVVAKGHRKHLQVT